MSNEELGDVLSANQIRKHELALERQRRYREKHREELRAKARAYDAEFRKTEHRKKYLEENKEKFSEVKKEWYQRNKGKVLKRVRARSAETTEQRKAYLKEYRQRPEVKALKCQQEARYREKNQNQIHARRLAYAALKEGKIQKTPCEECGKIKVEMHHPDYSKPLQVRFLCKRHHMLADGIIPLS